MMKRFLVPALLIAFAAGTAKAGQITGSLAIVDMGTTIVNTGDINTATTFTFGDLISTQNTSGTFSGPPTALPDQNFHAPSFSTSAGTNTSLSIESPLFGTFTSTSIKEIINTPGFVVLSILGNYSGGRFDPGTGTNPASVILTFSQNPVHTGVISGSGIFSVAPNGAGGGPQAVPEPATVVMGLTSVLGGGLFYLLRRRRSAKTIA